jgi:hypothetical protein
VSFADPARSAEIDLTALFPQPATLQLTPLLTLPI